MRVEKKKGETPFYNIRWAFRRQTQYSQKKKNTLAIVNVKIHAPYLPIFIFFFLTHPTLPYSLYTVIRLEHTLKRANAQIAFILAT